MIVLYILLGILGFLLLLFDLLGAVKLSVRAAYCQSPLLIVGVGPFKLTLFGGEKQEEAPERKPAKKPAGKAPKKKKKRAKKEKKPSKIQEKPPLMTVVTAFRDLVFGLLRSFKRHIKIEELRLRVLIASDDAAKTALEYGAVNALVEPVYLLATQAPRVRKDRVSVGVECDFLADKPEVDAELCVSVRIWRLYLIALCSLKSLLRAISLLKAFTFAAEGKEEEPAGSK